jgi:hypothetical protein
VLATRILVPAVVILGLGVTTGAVWLAAGPTADDARRADDRVEGARQRDDADALDAYAETLGLAMIKTRGDDAADYARHVDGPGPGVEVLAATDSADGPSVVLRVRIERTGPSFLTPGDTYEISACYRWTFGPADDYQPRPLDSCPDTAVLQLGPAPVEPTLPMSLDTHLSAALEPLAAAADPAVPTIESAVRAAYATAAAEEATAPGRDDVEVMAADVALDGAWLVLDGDTVGIAVGHGEECRLAGISQGRASVWAPDRISLQPGEIGCDAHAAAAAVGGQQ